MPSTLIDYEAIVADVKFILNDLGREITLVQRPTGAPSEVGGPPSGSEVTQTIKGVFVEPSSAIRLGMSTDNSDLITKSSHIVILPPTYDIRDYQEIEDSGVRYEITAVETLKPGEVTLLYYAGVKR